MAARPRGDSSEALRFPASPGAFLPGSILRTRKEGSVASTEEVPRRAARACGSAISGVRAAVPGVTDGDRYRFYVVGTGERERAEARPVGAVSSESGDDSRGLRLDRACPDLYRWHDQSYRTPALQDLVVYQLHVGRLLGP